MKYTIIELAGMELAGIFELERGDEEYIREIKEELKIAINLTKEDLK